MPRFALCVVLSALGCFGPNLPTITCQETVGCPGDLVCLEGECRPRGGNGDSDAGGNDGAPGSFSITADFETGQCVACTYDGEGLVPTGESGGVWTSPVYDGEHAQTAWTQLAWIPSAAYGKPLPNDGAAEVGYSTNVDMQGNALLFHCDEVSSSVLDNSGEGNAGAPVEGNTVDYDVGRIGSACLIGAGNHFGVPIAGTAIEPGVADFSWAFWVQTDTTCEGNDVFVGADADPLGAEGSHMWIGCARGDDAFDQPNCVENATGVVAGTVRGSQTENGGNPCTVETVNDGAWHHIAVTKSGYPDYTLKVFVDGADVDTKQETSQEPFEFGAADLLTFGTFAESGFDTEGKSVIDEVAVFRRRLSQAEVRALFHRGASTIELRVRSCDDPACEGEPFTGASGSEVEPIIDPPGANSAPEPVALSIAPGRYFQFQVQFSRISLDAIARIEAATITGQR